MKIEEWDTFSARARRLAARAPLRTRAVLKYSATRGRLVVKVTDDVAVSGCEERGEGKQRGGDRMRRTPTLFPLHTHKHTQQCLQYVTDQQADVKRVERLAAALLTAAATGVPPPAEDEGAGAASGGAAAAGGADTKKRTGKAKGAKGGGARRG